MNMPAAAIMETSPSHLSEAEVAARFEELADRYYDEFAGPVANLEKFLPETEQERSELWHGNGGNSEVHPVTTATGTYAVRLSRWAEGTRRDEVTNASIDGLIRGKGIPGVEQIAAASKEEGKIVTEFVPGHDGMHLTKEDIASITDDHLSAYLDTALAMQERGLKLDTKNLGNFIYSPDSGFTVIDYEYGEDTLLDKVVFMAQLLRSGSLASTSLAKDPAVFAASAADSLTRKELLIRFERVCAERLAGHPETEAILGQIQRRVESAQNQANQDSDPESVARRIAASERWSATMSRSLVRGGRIFISLDD